MNVPSWLLKDGRLRPFLRVLVYLCAVLAAFVFGYTIVGVITIGLNVHWSNNALLAASVLIEALATVGVALLLRRFLDRRSEESLGLPLRTPAARLLAIGLLFGAGMQTVVFVLETLFGHVRPLGFGSPSTDVELLCGALVIFGLAALSEEMSMRGYVLQNLWEDWGFWPALAVSSVSFALLHLRNPHASEHAALTALGLIAFGVWACLSVRWSGSLWLALGCHFAWNVFEGPVYGFPVSGIGMPLPTVVQTTLGWPSWFTGGGFGPEAGLSSIVAMLIGGVGLWLLHRRRLLPVATPAP